MARRSLLSVVSQLAVALWLWEPGVCPDCKKVNVFSKGVWWGPQKRACPFYILTRWCKYDLAEYGKAMRQTLQHIILSNFSKMIIIIMLLLLLFLLYYSYYFYYEIFQFALFEAFSQVAMFPGYEDCSIVRFDKDVLSLNNIRSNVYIWWMLLNCSLLSTGFVAYNDHYAFALQQRSPFRFFKRGETDLTRRDLLNHWLVKMTESGELKRITGKYEKVT